MSYSLANLPTISALIGRGLSVIGNADQTEQAPAWVKGDNMSDPMDVSKWDLNVMADAAAERRERLLREENAALKAELAAVKAERDELAAEQRCRKEGWQARIAGERATANPYRYNSDEYRLWHWGWSSNDLIRHDRRKSRLAQKLVNAIRAGRT